MRLAAILFLIIFMHGTALADQYLCEVKKSTGFRFSESSGAWDSTDFKAGDKYTLTNNSGKYLLYAFGHEEAISKCPKGFNDSGFIFCDGWLVFSFYKKSGRFTAYSEGSYHQVGSEVIPKDSSAIPNPSVSIGECAEF